MARENITKFIEAAMGDRALAGELAELATECGYSFTAEELLALGASRPLSDDDAGRVSGGWPW